MTTAVHRQFDAGDPLASLLDAQRLHAQRRFHPAFRRPRGAELSRASPTWTASPMHSCVSNDPAPASSSARMSPTSRLDPTRRQLSGAKGGISIERQNARHWLWEAGASFTTPEFETNDIGRLARADGVLLFERAGVSGDDAGTLVATVRRSASGSNQSGTTAATSRRRRIGSELSLTLPNFWEAELNATYEFRRQDMRLTRGGPSMQRPASWSTTLAVETREGAQTQGDLEAAYGRDEDGGLSITLAPSIQRAAGAAVGAVGEPVVRSRGGHPAVRRDAAGRSARNLRRPLYLRPAGSVHLFRPGSRELHLQAGSQPRLLRRALRRRADATSPSASWPRRARAAFCRWPLTCCRRKIFWSGRSGAIWCCAGNGGAGSVFYLVWQQNRAEEETTRERASIGDMFRSLGARGDNFFAVKMSLWLSR